MGLAVISPIVTCKLISEPGLWVLRSRVWEGRLRGEAPFPDCFVGLSFLGPSSSPSQPTAVPLISSWLLYFPGGKGLCQLDFHPESASPWALLEQWRVLVCSLTLTHRFKHIWTHIVFLSLCMCSRGWFSYLQVT